MAEMKKLQNLENKLYDDDNNFEKETKLSIKDVIEDLSPYQKAVYSEKKQKKKARNICIPPD